MEFPKLVIASDGQSTGVLWNGVFLGHGIGSIEFTANGKDGAPRSFLKLIDVDLKHFEPNGGEEQFREFMQSITENDST